MPRSWAVCACFFERNIYVPGLSHLTFKNPEQFSRDYGLTVGSHKLQDTLGTGSNNVDPDPRRFSLLGRPLGSASAQI